MNETIVTATTKLFHLRDDMEIIGIHSRPLTNQEMEFIQIMNEMEQALNETKKPAPLSDDASN